MVAILITVVGLLGLLKSVELAMEHNLRNQLRDEAVLIGEDWMSNLKVRPFDQISGVTTTTGITTAPFSARQVKSKLRGGNSMFSVTRPCASLPTNPVSAQLVVQVDWNYKGVPYSHQVRSVRSE
jgi:type IV pilus assembly protein PilV